MINDIYLRFKKLYKQSKGKILIQNFRLEKEPSICLKIDDNGKIIEKLIALDDTIKKNELYDWFAIRNIKSKYLNNNKAVGSKMIFSSNNYTFFARIDTLPLITYKSFVKLFDVKEDKKNNKTTAKSIFYNKYKKEIEVVFSSIKSIITLDDLICKMDFIIEDDIKLIKESFISEKILNSYYKKLCDDCFCKEEQFFRTNKINYILSQIKDEIIEYGHKQIKLKIFRDTSIEEYEQMELNYLNNSLFAVNDKFINIKKEIFGQPYLDNTLNTDKPFMIHKTMKSFISFPKKKEDILYIKYLDDYLSANKGIFYLELEKFSVSSKPFINKKQFIVQKKKNYEVFELIPCFQNEFEKNPFVVKNYMRITKKGKIVEDKQSYKDKYLLEKDIDNLCNKKLIKNYFSDKIKGIDKQLESYIFLIRDSCFLYFRKAQIAGKEFYSQIEKVISYLIVYHYEHNDENQIKLKVMESLNLKFSMQQYFKGECMDVGSELKALNKKISANNYVLLTDKEFLLLAGQIAYYLVSQSEASNRTFRLVEHYLKSKNIQTIKKYLRNDLEKYKHKIYLITDKSKFKNALTMLIAYDEDKKLTYRDMDIFLIGLVGDNIFYQKTEEVK